MNESLKQKLLSPDSAFNSTQLSSSQENSLINENFYAYDKVIKIMLMGNKGVGKTTFLTSLLKLLNDDKNSNKILPTMSLEIKKKIHKLKHNLYNLEFWDTNEQILNSAIIKSKLKLILAYLKLCHSFIIICDLSQYSVNFAEKQIENILKYSYRPNILIVYNNVISAKNERLCEIVERYSLRTVESNKLDLAVLDEYLLSC
jgi:GTPase SAR1 family protein